MLLYLCQIFIFLLGHLQFFLHFFFTFMENLFKKHPIRYRGVSHLVLTSFAIIFFGAATRETLNPEYWAIKSLSKEWRRMVNAHSDSERLDIGT